MTLTPPSDPSWHIPQFNLRIEDLAHPGVAVFLGAVGNNTAATLRTAVLSSFKWLYSPQTVPRNVQSIELVLRAMNGVATASGNAEHKKIHFSLDYIRDTADRAHDEILGVLTHEVVHCYQHTAQGTCPPGFVEGIADYVRLRAGLAPPHWRRSGGRRWDGGYDRTAYFLEWLEERYGDGTVQELNASMLGVEYDERIFKRTTGRPIRKLWKMYCKHLEGEGIEE